MLKRLKGAVGALSLVIILTMILCLVPTMVLASNDITGITSEALEDGSIKVAGNITTAGDDVTLVAVKMPTESQWADIITGDLGDFQAAIVYIDQFASDNNGDWEKVFTPREVEVAGDAIGIFVGGKDVETVAKAPVIPLGADGFTVSGYVEVPVAVGATVALNGQEATTDEYGYFTFEGVEAGTYDLEVTAKSAITRTISVTVLDADVEVSLATNKITLMFGDVTGDDNAVSFADLVALQGSYNKSEGDDLFNDACDLNNDGSVSFADLVTLQGNYNKTIDSYPEWVK